MKTLQALQAAGFEQFGDFITRGGFSGYGFQVLRHFGVPPCVVFGHFCNGGEYDPSDAKVELVDGDLDAALAALVAMPFGSRTVGDFCGVPAVALPTDPAAALEAAGWSVKPQPHSDLYANRSPRYYHELDEIDVWQDEDDGPYIALLGDDRDNHPCAEGETADAAFWALMALPFGSSTVGVFVGVAG